MEKTEEEKIKLAYRMNRYKFISNLILIGFLIALAVYIVLNVEELKTLGNDVCAMCMKQTGGICYKLGIK